MLTTWSNPSQLVQQMSQLNVVVAYTDKEGKFYRLNVKVNKSGTIKDIVQHSCSQLGMDNWQDYHIMHGKITLQNSTLLRLSGLLPGAKLDLVRKSAVVGQQAEQNVSIAVQCDAGRATLQISSSATFFHILKSVEDRSPLYQVKGDEIYEPVMVLLGQEYFGLSVLMKNRLTDLGISRGNCLIRLSYRKSPLSLSVIQNILTFPIPSVVDNADSSVPQTIDNHPNEAVQMEACPSPSIPPPPALSERDRNIRIITPSLSPNTSILPSAPSLPDSYYELNEIEFKNYFASAQRQTRSLIDAPLISKTKLNEKAEREFLANHPTTVIRFRFASERRLIEVTFDSIEKTSELFAFIRRECLVDANMIFELSTAPPKRLIKENTSPLWKSDLTPASIVNVSFPSSLSSLEQSIIKPEVFSSNPNIQNTVITAEDCAVTTAVAPSKSILKKPSWLRK